MKYSTFEGKSVDVNKVDHQHLSNIYWFQKIFNNTTLSKLLMERFDKEFDGVILPYRPHPKFKQEIDRLEYMGLLSWKEIDGRKCADIIWDGHVVGEACYIEDIREDIINQIVR